MKDPDLTSPLLTWGEALYYTPHLAGVVVVCAIVAAVLGFSPRGRTFMLAGVTVVAIGWATYWFLQDVVISTAGDPETYCANLTDVGSFQSDDPCDRAALRKGLVGVVPLGAAVLALVASTVNAAVRKKDSEPRQGLTTGWSALTR